MRKLSIMIAIALLVVSSAIPVKSKENERMITGRQFVVDDASKLTASMNTSIFYISCENISCDFKMDILSMYMEKTKKWSDNEHKRMKVIERYFSCVSQTGSHYSCNAEKNERLQTLESIPYVPMSDYIKQELQKVMKKADVIYTDVQGNYSLKCPSSTCLIFSNINTQKQSQYWIEVVGEGSNIDLTDSNSLSFKRRDK